MKVLAIEAACPPGSMALSDGESVQAFRLIEHTRRTTATFAGIMRDLLRGADWQAGEIDLVATTEGPGSFTGIRIGVTAAKVFAYASGAAVVGVNTLEVIARQISTDVDVEVVLDAQRGELFAARFRKRSDSLELLIPTEIIHADDWLKSRTSGVVVSGPALGKLADRLRASVVVADESAWLPRADTLAHCALLMKSDEVASDPLTLVPRYYRRSAAEEKADKAP
jgi:tRNA threonylcarbamoyladenosine biosynthesis protein TsaB